MRIISEEKDSVFEKFLNMQYRYPLIELPFLKLMCCENKIFRFLHSHEIMITQNLILSKRGRIF